MRPALALIGSLVVGVGAGGCPTQKASEPAAKPCCEQPKAEPGVTPFVVTGDDVTGPSDGQKVTLRVGLSQPAKRDQIYPVLHTLYRHVMKRGAFEPIHFEGKVYASEAQAKQGGDQGVVARIWKEQSDIAPKCENKVTYDFTEQAERTFAATVGRGEEESESDTCRLSEKKKVVRADDKFTHKPSLKVDPARQAVEVNYPYLELGKDEYIKELKFNSAMRDWIEHVNTFFRRIDGLKELTFVGIHNDQPVVRITTTRAQFDAGLSNLQEEIASHAAITFASLGMKKKTDKGAEKEQTAFHAKTYKAALANLPQNQVSISKKLK